jgi:hypothetical protein
MMVPQHLTYTMLGHHAPDRQTGNAIQVYGIEPQFLVHRFQAFFHFFIFWGTANPAQ